MPVLNSDTGESLEYHQLRNHLKYEKNWEEHYCNEIGIPRQGIETGDKGHKKQRFAGTETFRVIWYEDVTAYRRNEVTYKNAVCEIGPQKDDPNRTRITVGGNIIIYPGDVATPLLPSNLPR